MMEEVWGRGKSNTNHGLVIVLTPPCILILRFKPKAHGLPSGLISEDYYRSSSPPLRYKKGIQRGAKTCPGTPSKGMAS